jgi:hypothetical protein
MKATRVVLSAALFVFCDIASAATDTFDIDRRDHQIHAGASYGATVTTSLILHELDCPASPLIAGLVVLGAGFLKESTDSRYSAGDMQANAVGVATGAVFSMVITF